MVAVRNRLPPQRKRLPMAVKSRDFSPEALAYALPGGLAKLAYPRWIYAPHLRFLEDKLLAIANGEQVFLMVSAPPRSGKSMFLSRVVPCWYLGRFPDSRVMLITHSVDFSRSHSRASRNIMEVYGKKVFNVELAVDTAAASMWDIRYHAGGMEALGSGSSVQGRGANLLIMDDLVAGYEMASNPLLLHRQWEWFLTDVYPRLEPGASAIILNTRWALDDMIGMIKKAQSEEGLFLDWESVNFPAISTGVNDPLGRPAGEALFPERFPVKRLEAIKKHMMAQGQDEGYWEALYQGNPVAPRGTIVDINWIQRYEHSDIPGPGERDKWEMLVISADTASKETELADFTVIGIWGVLNSQYFLLNIIREKMPWPELVTTCKTLQGVYRPDFFLVEDKGSGISLIQEMRQDQMYNVWPMNPGSENKVIRLQAETPVLRAGKVWVPKSAPWVDEFLLELRAFPRGRRDQADMMSQFLKFFRQAAGGVQMF